MSWLFGSRKKSSGEEGRNLHVESVGDFDVVSYRSPVGPSYPRVPYPTYATQGPTYAPTSSPAYPLSPSLYPAVPGAEASTHNPTANSQPHSPHNPLESIPFRLSSQVASPSLSIKSDLLLVQNLLRRIREEINSNSFEYNFSTERSVLKETIFN